MVLLAVGVVLGGSVSFCPVQLLPAHPKPQRTGALVVAAVLIGCVVVANFTAAAMVAAFADVDDETR